MKFLFGIIFSVVAAVDSKEWVSLERPQKSAFEETLTEEDRSVWVLFAKQLEGETLLLRFPDDPQYRYSPSGEMEVSSEKEGEQYSLFISPLVGEETLEQKAKEIALQSGVLFFEVERLSPHTLDLLYRQEGKWIRERFHLTPHHFYHLQMKANLFLPEGYRQFIQSFAID